MADEIERTGWLVGGELVTQEGAEGELAESASIAAVAGPLAGVAEVIAIGSKIIAGAVELARAADALGNWWSEATHGITNIKAWGNATSHTVHVYKTDGDFTRKDYRTLPPGMTVNGGADMWIPWCTNSGEYPRKHGTIVVGGQAVAFFWQEGDTVRFNVQNAYLYDAPGIPGASQSGGERTLVIAQDQGKLGFAMSTFKRP